MIPNINPETGVHYGVCNGNYEHLPDDWFDMFSRVYYNDNGDEFLEGEEREDDAETEYYKCNMSDFRAEYNSNTNIIMIFFSKKTIKCRPCSPCYPNAGDLDSPDEYGIETYTFND